jgi:hypothetical protein
MNSLRKWLIKKLASSASNQIVSINCGQNFPAKKTDPDNNPMPYSLVIEDILGKRTYYFTEEMFVKIRDGCDEMIKIQKRNERIFANQALKKFSNW